MQLYGQQYELEPVAKNAKTSSNLTGLNFVRFSRTLNKASVNQLSSSFPQVVGYYGDNIYLIYGDADLLSSRYSVEMTGALKLEAAMKMGNQVEGVVAGKDVESGNESTVDIIYVGPKSLSQKSVISGFDVEVVRANDDANSITVIASKNELEKIASLPWVVAIERSRGEFKVDINRNLGNRIRTGINAINVGEDLRGQGIKIGVGDGGRPSSHIDLSGQTDVRISDNIEESGHATHVTGTIVGRGTLSFGGIGMASGASVISNFYDDIINNAPSYMAEGLTLTNNSYSPTSIPFGSYTQTESAFIDKQLRENPDLLHMFSAGNNGWQFDQFGGAEHKFATVSGGFNSSKNALTVANETTLSDVGVTSSKGPTGDGRIKPEISAYGASVYSTWLDNGYKGVTGTSMSTPTVTGAMALASQKYKQQHGTTPPGALLKAVLCNSAEDGGNPGPDYKFGFGSLNIIRALRTIENEDYFQSSINNGATSIHNITVPAGVSQLKVLLYWADREAAPGAGQALVNNLDLTIDGPGGNYLPWVLDAANPDNNATTGVDNLNNIEQITIYNPSAGSYGLNVAGTDIPFGPQDYYLIYEFVVPEIQLLYPIGGETLIPGGTERIRWRSSGISGSLDIELSTDGGSSWSSLSGASTAFDAKIYFVPSDLHTSQGRIRITHTTSSVQASSQEDFTVLGTPEVNMAPFCFGHVQLTWDPVDNASSYEILSLDASDEMVVIGNTSSTSFLAANLDTSKEHWFSVRSVHADGGRGKRTLANSVLPGEGACPWSDDLAIASVVKPAQVGRKYTSSSFNRVELLIKNVGNNAVGNFNITYQIDGGAPVVETFTGTIASGEDLIYQFAPTSVMENPGQYLLTTAVQLSGDSNPGNDTGPEQWVATLLDNQPLTLPYTQDFESIPEVVHKDNLIGLQGADRIDYFQDVESGRLRSNPGPAYHNSGTRSLTMDSGEHGTEATNELVITLNLENYAVDSDLALDLSLIPHFDEPDPEDKIWIRGSDNDTWLELLNWGEFFAGENSYQHLSALGISNLLETNGQVVSSSTQLRFGQKGNTAASGVLGITTSDGLTIDDLVIRKVGDDVEVLSLLGPQPNCSLAMENIEVQIRNNTATTISNVPINYKVNEGATISEVIPSLAAGQTLNFTFSSTFDFSAPGTYSVAVWSSLPSDLESDNNMISSFVHNRPLITSFPYLEDFESGTGNWTAGGSISTWEWGTPVGTKINSSTKAWVTNLSGNYSLSENGYIESPCFDLTSFTTNPFLALKLAYEIQLWEADMAYVEFSEDNSTWQLLGSFESGPNWYNTDGTIDSWQGANLDWHVAGTEIPLNLITDKSSVRFRIVFESNDNNNKEGIGIDEISILDAGTDLSLESVSLGDHACVLGAETVAISVKNLSALQVNNVDVKYQVNGGATITETITQIAAGATEAYVFSTTFDASADGSYSVDAWVDFAGDNFSGNDRLNGTTLTNLVTHSQFPYYEDFEGSNSGWNQGGTLSSWGIGSPIGVQIDTVANGGNAWVTNLSGPYNKSEASFLYSPCFNLTSFGSDPIMSFALRQNGLPFQEGLKLEYSTDGSIWLPLGAAGTGYNWYNFSQIWDGISEPWEVASHVIPASGMGDASSVQFRYAFVDNALNNVELEGFGVDDFSIQDNEQIYGGGGVTLSSTSVGGGWVKIYSGGQLVASIHDDGNVLGTIDLTVFQVGANPRTWQDSLYLDRNFLINTQNSIPGDYIVRLYLKESEILSLTTDPNSSIPSQSKLYVNHYFGQDPDGDISNNDARYFRVLDNRLVKAIPFQDGYYLEFHVDAFGEFYAGEQLTNPKFIATQSGSWANPTTWGLSCGGCTPLAGTHYPGELNNAEILAGVNVSVPSGDYSANDLTVDANTAGALNLSTGGKLTINGRLATQNLDPKVQVINGNGELIFTGNKRNNIVNYWASSAPLPKTTIAVDNANGTATITGDGGELVFGEGLQVADGKLQVEGTTGLQVTNDLSLQESTTLDITVNDSERYLKVGGDITMVGSMQGEELLSLNGSQPQSISGTLSFKKIEIAGDISNEGNISVTRELQLQSGATLDADGSGEGSFILKSDENQTAFVTAIPADATISGDITYQRYFTASDVYMNIAIPVANTPVSELQDDIPVTGNFTGTNNGNGLGPAASLYYYDESAAGEANLGWTPYPTPNGSNTELLSPLKGYASWMRAEHANPATIDATGAIGQGPINLLVTYTNTGDSGDGWNLVANPYPSAINWNDANWTKTNVNAIAAIRDSKNGMYLYSSGSWDGIVPSGQSFWVQTNAANPSLIASEQVKHADGTTTLYRPQTRQRQGFTLSLSDQKIMDLAFVNFNADATEEFDTEFDARKLSNRRHGIASGTKSGEFLAINTLPNGGCGRTIPLVINNIPKGEFTIDIEVEMENVESVYLYDSVMASYHNLLESRYQFSTSQHHETIEERFEIEMTFMVGEAPAITFTDGILYSNRKEGNQWFKDGEPIEGATDQELEASSSGEYYVVNTTGGCTQQSATVNVQITNIDLEPSIIVAYPNPASEKLVVEIPALSNPRAVLLNSQGQIIKEYSLKSHSNELELNSLKPGIYHLNIIENDEELYSYKVLIQ